MLLDCAVSLVDLDLIPGSTLNSLVSDNRLRCCLCDGDGANEVVSAMLPGPEGWGLGWTVEIFSPSSSLSLIASWKRDCSIILVCVAASIP